MADQVQAATSADQGRNEVRSMIGRVVAWTLANQFNAKHALDEAALKTIGASVQQIPPSAFGNTNVTIAAPQTTAAASSPLLKAAGIALATLGLGAGGLGLFSLGAGLLQGKAPQASALPVATSTAAEEIPLIVDWSLENGDGNTNPTDAGTN